MINHLAGVIDVFPLSILVHHLVRYVSRSYQFIRRRHVTVQRVDNKLGLHVQTLALSLVQFLNDVTHADVAAKLPCPAVSTQQTNIIIT